MRDVSGDALPVVYRAQVRKEVEVLPRTGTINHYFVSGDGGAKAGVKGEKRCEQLACEQMDHPSSIPSLTAPTYFCASFSTKVGLGTLRAEARLWVPPSVCLSDFGRLSHGYDAGGIQIIRG
jgi:hypothetical protein